MMKNEWGIGTLAGTLEDIQEPVEFFTTRAEAEGAAILATRETGIEHYLVRRVMVNGGGDVEDDG